MDDQLDLNDERDVFAERYAAFGLQTKKLFAVKAKLAATKAKAAAVKLKASAAQNIRYTAYSSDVGEAFRPVVPSWAVKGTYGLAVTYILGEIGVTTYKAQQQGEEPVRAFAHAAVFQGIASLVLPMVVIHQTVHAAQAVTKRAGRFTRWGPTVAGLALIPALPYMIDEPCEHIIDSAFDKWWPKEEEPAEVQKARLQKKDTTSSFVVGKISNVVADIVADR